MFSETPTPNYGIHETFGRPLKAPTAPEVNNWPTQKEIGWPTGGSSLADQAEGKYERYVAAQQGQADEDIAKTEHINPSAYDLAHPHVPSKAEIPRQGAPPKSAEVANWPFPQYAQAEAAPVAKPVDERAGMIIHPTFNDAHFHSPKHVWDRSEKAPTGPAVLGWPETSPPKDDEKKATTPAAKAPALMELMKDDDKKKVAANPGLWGASGEPEKVHILEPLLYKEAADANPQAQRTTYYAAPEGKEAPKTMTFAKPAPIDENSARDEPNMYRYSADKSLGRDKHTFYAQNVVDGYMNKATEFRI